MKHVYSEKEDTGIQKAFFALHYAHTCPVYNSLQYTLFRVEFQCTKIYAVTQAYQNKLLPPK